MKNNHRKKLFLIPLCIAAVLFGLSLAVMLLWNNLLPQILHVGTITYWQAMGIFVLCKILFGFGPGKGGGAPWMRRKQMMAERMQGMSNEDRERFKEQLKARCGWGKSRWDNYDNPETKEAKTE